MININKNFIELLKYSYTKYPFSLSLKELFYLRNYTFGGYLKINKDLRNGTDSNSIKQANYMDNALNKFNFDTNLTVYRYEKLTYMQLLDLNSKLEQGSYIDPSYVSTSVKRNYGWHCLSYKRDYSLALYKIEIPSTLVGAYISPISVFGFLEQEFLLKRDNEFLVQELNFDNSNRLIQTKLKVKI